MRALSCAAAAGLLAIAVTAGTGSAAWASDETSHDTSLDAVGPSMDAGDDGSCDTRPTSYPADGEPVPENAACELLTDDIGAVVGEVWSWADSASVQWYSYAADTIGDVPVGGAVVMCGSTDPGEYGDTYPCSPDSTYLLFTVAGVFVEWPTSLENDLYYCQLTAFGDDDTHVLGRACGTVSAPAGPPPGDGGGGGGGGTADAGPTSTPTPSEPPTEPEPSQAPTATAPPEPSSVPSTPADPDPPSDTAGAPQDPPALPTTTTPPAGVVPSDGSTSAGAGSTPDPTQVSSTTPGAVDDSRAIESESVARVGGAPVPMGFFLVLAGALALGGYLTLAGPGFIAARRRRR